VFYPRHMGLGFVHGVALHSRVVAAVTVPWYKILSKQAHADTATHVFTWFKDLHGEVRYFEALEGAGWRGPLPIYAVHEWADEVEGRWVKEYDLTKFLALTDSEIERRYEFCLDMLSYWTYNTPQLVLQLRTAGLARLLVRSSPRDVICSEAASAVCHSDMLDFRVWCGKRDFDDISPDVLHRAVLRLVLTCPALKTLSETETVSGLTLMQRITEEGGLSDPSIQP
jgi:hypothetical protein